MCRKMLNSEEKALCTSCYMRLPFTGYHLLKENSLEKYFWTLFPIQRATSLFYHEGFRTRHIVYTIKYYGRPKVGYYLAQNYARELQDAHFFEGVDAIVPLPLHWKRQLSRHYNQSHYIARGISSVTGIPVYTNVVKRIKNNPSQTHLSTRERVKNVEGIFQLKRPERIAGKHILLVDDVTTTGSTLTSCAKELAKASHVTISILTLAVATQSPLIIVKNTEVDSSPFGIPLVE